MLPNASLKKLERQQVMRLYKQEDHVEQVVTFDEASLLKSTVSQKLERTEIKDVS